MPKVTVIGTTSWGITLAYVQSGKKYNVNLCARTPEEAAEITRHPENVISTHIRFPPNLTVTASVKSALENSDAVIIAVPSQSMRQNIKLFAEFLTPHMLIINAAKGLEIILTKLIVSGNRLGCRNHRHCLLIQRIDDERVHTIDDEGGRECAVKQLPLGESK